MSDDVSLVEVLEAVRLLDQRLAEAWLRVDARLVALERKCESHVLYTPLLVPHIMGDSSGEPGVVEALRDAGIDPVGLLNVNPGVVKPVRFLGDKWGGVNDVLVGLGWRWVRDGRDSRWELT